MLDPNLSGKVHFDGEPDLVARFAALMRAPEPVKPVSFWKRFLNKIREANQTRLTSNAS